jgi:hypothetical protein
MQHRDPSSTLLRSASRYAAAVIPSAVMGDEAMTPSERTEHLRGQLEADATEWSQRADQDAGDAGLLDKAQLVELDAWLTPEARRQIAVSEAAESFIAASRAAAARRRWWQGRSSLGGVLAILLILLILATPVTLLAIVGFTAALIHRALN